jgi:hypothetical protein
MSNAPLPPLNPYSTSYGDYAPPVQTAVRLPTFCLVMFILSLIFAILRIPVVAFGIYNWLSVRPGQINDAILVTAPFEILAGAAIVLFGIPGNIGMLVQRRWGVVLGFLTVFSSLFSLAVALWQLLVLYQSVSNSAQQAGFLVGAMITLVIRGTLIGLFALAVLMMHKYLRLKEAQAA